MVEVGGSSGGVEVTVRENSASVSEPSISNSHGSSNRGLGDGSIQRVSVISDLTDSRDLVVSGGEGVVGVARDVLGLLVWVFVLAVQAALVV